MHAVRNGQLLTFRCPGTSLPAVCRIRFSIASFHSVISRMTWKAEVSDSAVQSTVVLREPIQTTDLADNSLGAVECTAHYPGSRGVADIVSVTMPLLSIKDLAVNCYFHQSGA